MRIVTKSSDANKLLNLGDNLKSRLNSRVDAREVARSLLPEMAAIAHSDTQPARLAALKFPRAVMIGTLAKFAELIKV
jgi:hypothetical protein